MTGTAQEGPAADGLRERLSSQQDVPVVKREEAQADRERKSDPNEEQKEKKTFGRTADGTGKGISKALVQHDTLLHAFIAGVINVAIAFQHAVATVFVVPQTHDMVSQLLSPTQPKNLSDITVLAVLALHILALYLLPSFLRRPVFAVVFLFWRGCYNVGIGYLLLIQSHHCRLVTWAKRSGIFENPSNGRNPHPNLYKIIKRELETKIPEDYVFDEAPIEYNTWLVFRRVVDLILMCDFVSYCLFAIACGGVPEGESLFMTVARWVTGLGLVGFNLWVKLDAHRVVKDFAWYWGDFFYLVDKDLTFDGVFEMAPHPMYSVGYAGYYGISMMAASYSVLFISIVAHAAQFAFLFFVESPHIEKTYNPPPTRKEKAASSPDEGKIRYYEEMQSNYPDDASVPRLASSLQPSPVHNLMGLRNIDLYRITDTSVLVLQIYMFTLTILTPSTPPFQTFFVLNAIAWRLWFSAGLGYVLHRQSTEKTWSRHFVKFGESIEEAWRQWKGMYHLSLTMSYVSFVAATWKMYTPPPHWGYGLVPLYHILGVMLVALQLWTVFSIYDSLGEFGWFFGDFFFDHAPKLTHSGIYRYLNNPERVIGLAGVWGAVLITRSKAIFLVALLSHLLTLGFIQFVERPHMRKLYGGDIKHDAGLVKNLKRSLPPPLRQWQGNVDKVLGETVDFVEDFIESARPKFATGVDLFVKDTKTLFRQYPARISLTRLAPDLAGYDPKDYSLEVEGIPSSALAVTERSSDKEGQTGRQPPQRTSEFKTLIFEYGTPIKVKWTAPLKHGKKDWVGLYMVADNATREATRIASAGRWVATNPGAYDSTTADRGIQTSNVRTSGAERSDGEEKDFMRGEMVFEGDKLWWTQGVFEFRYHHDGNHNVMAISLPFEIRIGKFDEDDVENDSSSSIRGAAEKALLTVVRNCFDRDPNIAPTDIDEDFGPLVERSGKFAKRVVYAVHQMFGIEFASEVVQADGNVRNLAWRICNAKKVLV
ncbi:MAG: phosphatidylethanolamine N-methyltransferase [Sclerophora amabilis]|nr:MAG: phosphatidylethanolamine N-methyltransferase [Sclerophora amabilis]